jgi:Tfp pilus assembly protein PilO
VNLTLVKPQTPEIKGFYEELKMDVEFEGTFTNLMNFLSFISKVQRIITIRNVEIVTKEVVDGNSFLGVKGTFVSYRYLEGK